VLGAGQPDRRLTAKLAAIMRWAGSARTPAAPARQRL
jgi:hypothetical protein